MVTDDVDEPLTLTRGRYDEALVGQARCPYCGQTQTTYDGVVQPHDKEYREQHSAINPAKNWMWVAVLRRCPGSLYVDHTPPPVVDKTVRKCRRLVCQNMTQPGRVLCDGCGRKQTEGIKNGDDD